MKGGAEGRLDEPELGGRALLLRIIGLIAITAAALALRLPALEPSALYLDDVWVASLAKLPSAAALLELLPHHPLGFLAVERLAGRVGGTDGAQQVPPLIASLLLPWLGAALTYRITRRTAPALFTAALLAFNAALATAGVHLKPYALDADLTVGLLLLAYRFLDQPAPGRLLLLYGTILLAPFFSFTSLLVSFALVPAVLITRWYAPRKEARTFRRELLAGIVVVGLLVTLQLLLLRHQSNQALKEFWRDAFLPLSPLSESLTFLTTKTVRLGTRAFPDGWGFLALAAPLSLLLLKKERARPLGLFGLVLLGGLFAASALRLYPFGDPRTSIFTYPATVLLVVVTLSTLCDRLPSQRAVTGSFLLLTLAVSLSSARRSEYPELDDRRLVLTLQRNLREQDGLVVYPHTNWTLGHYGSWPVDFVKTDLYAAGFEVRIRRSGTLTLPSLTDYEDHPEVFDSLLADFLSAGYPRVAFLATHLEYKCCRAHQHIMGAIKRAGYRLAATDSAPAAQLLLFTR